ncbi:MAG: exopolyphosphatase / guanosine-5-triphosphate,3-diphosphate pyrophosphatase [Clostridia bacterium]|nr:aroB2 [Clostridiales bacterium]MDK2985345.1 exopolyphosphatase / guanosine-5-triphosphate,3-diphosphate pyrophosphatase [Clostridia bacterium]
MSLYAAIDIGTNSSRLLIGEKVFGKVIPKQMALRTTRLGEDLSQTGIIKKAAIDRTIKALFDFLEYMEKWDIAEVGVVATSAAREADNKEDFIKTIEEKTGLKVKIISGQEEASLSYRGAVSGVSVSGNPVVIDIGGGSTEIMCAAGEDIYVSSTKVGAVNCTENSTTPTEILEKLSGTLEKVKSFKDVSFVGVGGTITTLSAIKQKLEVYDPGKIHNSILKKEDVDKIFFELCSLTLAQRKKVPGLQPQRADIIVAGTLILWVIMTDLNVAEITVSEADILHGIILDL